MARGNGVVLDPDTGAIHALVIDGAEFTVIARIIIGRVETPEEFIATIRSTVVEILTDQIVGHVSNSIGGLHAQVLGAGDVVVDHNCGTGLTATHPRTDFAAVTEETIVASCVIVYVNDQMALFDTLINGT